MTLKEEIKLLLIAFAFILPMVLLLAIFINLVDIRFDLSIFPMMKHQNARLWFTWTDIFRLMSMYVGVFFLAILYKYIKYKRKKMQ